MNTCARCASELSDWELREAELLGVNPCWCKGIPHGVTHSLANIAYAELCHTGISQPVKTHDVARFVARHYGSNPLYSMNVALSQGKRFCWGGRALYGLARHLPLPGARSLAEAAYAVLLAAPREMYPEEIHFVLEQLNYRFNADSLFHHLRGYTRNRWGLEFHADYSNRIWVNSGRDARRAYNRAIQMCPTQVGFDAFVDEKLAPRVEVTLADRMRRLAELDGHAIGVAGDHIDFH